MLGYGKEHVNVGYIGILQQIRFPIPTKTQHGPLYTSNMIKKFCEKLIDNLTTCLKSMEKVSLMIS